MTVLFIIGALVALNFLLLHFSCNDVSETQSPPGEE
jgi:hypothetical protein